MNETMEGNLGKFVKIFTRLLKLILLLSIFIVITLYLFAIPLGLELFLFEKLSTTYSPSHTISVNLLNTQLDVSLNHLFISLISFYALCLALSWRKNINFHEVIQRFFSEPVSFHMKNFLFALPILSSLTYIAATSGHFLQGSYRMLLVDTPLPEDTPLAFFGLCVSPLTEEVIYRILPIGVFLVVRLLTLSKKRASSFRKERLKICFLAFTSPDDAKGMLGLKTVDGSGFWDGISLDEWMMVLFTSVFSAFSHYLFTSTWSVGWVVSGFIQGLVLGSSYLVYGVQAPILLRWLSNYSFYTYSLTTVIHPNLAVLNFLNEKLTLGLGGFVLLLTAYSGVRELANTWRSRLETVTCTAEKAKDQIRLKGDELLSHLRRLGFFDLASLILMLLIFSSRLAIVNSPKPVIGEAYYDTGFVFDESYYVKAARKMLVGEPANDEHPPLSKAFIMLGMMLFGDKPLGWRIFPILASSISIVLVYGITLLITEKKSSSFIAAMLFATDIMAFNIGQIAMLDAPSMMFVLAGSILLLRKRHDLGSMFFGLASLCKLNSVLPVAGIIIFLLLARFTKHVKKLEYLKENAYFIGRVFLIGFVSFMIGLWVYDAGYGVFDNNPISHLSFMYSYHTSHSYQSAEDVVLPLDWINPLNHFSPAEYHVTTVREISNSGGLREYHPIAYYGIYSPLWWCIWLVVPISLIEIVRNISENKEQGTGLFTLLWVVVNFFPYVLAAYVMKRWVYPFYFCMSLPGLYIGLSYYLNRSRLSKLFLSILILTHLFWFCMWFPVKPKVVIDLLLSLGLPA
jgi:4-amino-4-deoxy-L-arabinose transferase-like glycosyltransferase